MSRLRRLLLVAFLIALPVSAKPPATEGFVRIDKFTEMLDARLKELQEKEQFAKLPFEEQLVIMWAKGEKSYKKVRKINGPDVIETIFDWDEINKEPPTDSANRLAASLPGVLKKKYGESLKMDKKFKSERYKVGRVLVAQLVNPPLHVRELAIECLNAMHHTRRNYVADDPKDRRVRRQKAWKDYIERVKK